jgi:MFS family permease
MNTAANPPVEPATSTVATAAAGAVGATAVPSSAPRPWAADTHLPTALLLNIGHAFDHMFLLIFATAVATIAADFGFASWESLMPYSVGAFFLFGIGSLPAGRLGDLWGRRVMMIIFFVGIGCASLFASLANGPWQLAAGLMGIGLFASIYHPVGIPMLVQNAARPGWTIGINGLAGNLGIAVAALVTGLLVKYFGWRAAFAVPGAIAIGCGIAFALLVPKEMEAPAKRKSKRLDLAPGLLARVFLVMTATAITSSLLFNFTTNGNGQLLQERMRSIVQDPATLGALLAVVYAVASLAQLVVGKLIDRYPLKRIYLSVVVLQAPLFALAAVSEGWAAYVVVLGFMILIFGAIPFTDAIIVRFVDDQMRSRVSGVRLAISFGVSSLAVWLLGPIVKAAGFDMLLWLMAGIAVCTTLLVLLLPSHEPGRA